MTTATQIKERPILFSAPMVRAILDGRKTQTRRLVKPQPPGGARYAINGNQDKACCIFDCDSYPGGIGFCPPKATSKDHLLPCPYGRPGDRLWVRETFRLPVVFDDKSPSKVGRECVDAGYRSPWAPVRYEADGDDKFLELLQDFGHDWGKTRVSIHMPRWASRITLEITELRVERLHGITEADAIAEGIERSIGGKLWRDYGHPVMPAMTPKCSFKSLWQVINGPESWDANPWVWVVTFRRLD